MAALPADVSVLLIEHDMDLVFSFANRMTVLVNGTVLTEGDLLVAVRVPATGAGSGLSHCKLAFRERPAATVATWVRVQDGAPAEARIAVGSVGPLAIRALGAEALLLEGAPLEEVAHAAAEASGASEDANGSEEYKRQLVRVLVGRSLRDALRRAG